MKEKIILKSAHPEEYPDLEIECRFIPNKEIGKYLSNIPESEKFYAYKSGKVSARRGVEGEKIKTALKTVIDGKEYILAEEENTVKNREGVLDVVVTNISSTSNEQYVVRGEKFKKTYTPIEGEAFFLPVPESRQLTRVSENVIIMTLWEEPVLCLKGSYIVTYSAEESDYNALEKEAYELTYTKEEQKVKTKK